MPVVIDREAVTVSVAACGNDQIAVHVRLHDTTLGAVITAAEAAKLAEALTLESAHSKNPN